MKIFDYCICCVAYNYVEHNFLLQTISLCCLSDSLLFFHRPSTIIFAVFLRSALPLGALIMTYTRPQVQANYEVILLYPSSIKLQEKLLSL